MPHAYEGGNRLLDALPRAELEALRPELSVTTVDAKQQAQEPGHAIDHVDFPIDTVYSIVAILGDGDAGEVGTVGREGFTPVEASLGEATARRTTLCQIPGHSARLRRDVFVRALEGHSGLARLAQRNLSARLFAAEQYTACNLMHSVAERCARWLLMTSDRAGRDAFPVTQEFLATLLGVRRAGVTEAARSLKIAGAIDYHRGNLVINDARKLRAASCECYAATRDAFEQALTTRPRDGAAVSVAAG